MAQYRPCWVGLMAKVMVSSAVLPMLVCLASTFGCTDDRRDDSTTDAVVDAIKGAVDCTVAPATVSTSREGVAAPRRSLRCESADRIVLIHEYESAAAVDEMVAATAYCEPHIRVGPVLVEAVSSASGAHVLFDGTAVLFRSQDIRLALEPFGGESGRC